VSPVVVKQDLVGLSARVPGAGGQDFLCAHHRVGPFCMTAPGMHTLSGSGGSPGDVSALRLRKTRDAPSCNLPPRSMPG
jgi:hypothetical protein